MWLNILLFELMAMLKDLSIMSCVEKYKNDKETINSSTKTNLFLSADVPGQHRRHDDREPASASVGEGLVCPSRPAHLVRLAVPEARGPWMPGLIDKSTHTASIVVILIYFTIQSH